MRSVTHSASGRSAVKSRFTRSGARLASGSAIVVKIFLRRRLTPSMPIWRISRATWSRPISWPARRAARHSLSAPYPLRFATHSTINTCIITASRNTRADADSPRWAAA